MTRKDSIAPINLCPVCKSKTPKRALSQASEISRLCLLYNQLVTTFAEIKDKDENWLLEAGLRRSDEYYRGAGYDGVPCNNLSQLYPHPEKPKMTNCPTRADEMPGTCCDDLATQLIASESSRNQVTSSPFLVEPKSNHAKAMPSSATLLTKSALLLASFNSQSTTAAVNTQELHQLKELDDKLNLELMEIERQIAVADAAKEQCFTANYDQPSTLAILDGLELPSTPDISFDHIDSILVEQNPATPVPKKMRTVAVSTPAPQEKKRAIVKSGKNKAVKERLQIAQERIVLTTTLLNDDRIIELTKWVDLFGATVLPEFTPDSVTHLVLPTTPAMGVSKRTIKYFEALQHPDTCKIISYDWIVACNKSGKLLSEDRFLVKSDEHGYRQAANRTNQTMQHLFASYRFYLYGEFVQPPVNQLRKLVCISGGTIVDNVEEISAEKYARKRPSSQTSNSSVEAHGPILILCDANFQTTFEKDAHIIRRYPIISPSWIMDCISAGKVIDREKYFVL